MTVVLQSEGHCPACDRDTTFVARETWLRDHFLCSACKSIPRERALMAVIESYYPHWRSLTIHESSPVARGTSVRLKNECPGYVASQYFPGVPGGVMHQGFLCEDLARLTFADASVDLHVTQDVMEHVIQPDLVFQEIARTLRPGGAHIFTVPLVRRNETSVRRAVLSHEGRIQHVLPPEYHGNPVDPDGSLVTADWGFDIVQHIFDACGLATHTVVIDDLSKGIRAQFIEVLVTMKTPKN